MKEKPNSRLFIDYNDPVSKQVRKIPLDIFHITELDTAEAVQRHHWQAQGGYVCYDGRLVGSAWDCEVKNFPKEMDAKPQGFSGVLGQANKSDEARSSLVAGLISGAARNGIEPPMQEVWLNWEAIQWDRVSAKLKTYDGLPAENLPKALELAEKYKTIHEERIRAKIKANETRTAS